MWVELQFFSAHRVMILYICTMFHEYISNSLTVTERTRNDDRQMDDVITIGPPETPTSGALIIWALLFKTNDFVS